MFTFDEMMRNLDSDEVAEISELMDSNNPLDNAEGIHYGYVGRSAGIPETLLDYAYRGVGGFTGKTVPAPGRPQDERSRRGPAASADPGSRCSADVGTGL